jgi:hypothetical protein
MKTAFWLGRGPATVALTLALGACGDGAGKPLAIAVRTTGAWSTDVVGRLQRPDGVDRGPAAGARIAIDLPDGRRVERVADAEGAVELDVDWSRGPTATVTAALPQHVLTTRVIDEGTGGTVVKLALARIEPDPVDMVTVSGSMSNPMPGNYHPDVLADVGWRPMSVAGYTWSIQVERGVPFHLIAWQGRWIATSPREGIQEFPRIAVLEHAAAGEDVSGIDIDLLANAVTMQTATARLILPDRVDSPVRNSGWAYGLLYPSGFGFGSGTPPISGFGTRSELDTAEGAFDLDVGYVANMGTWNPVSQLFVMAGTSGSWLGAWTSYVELAGTPSGEHRLLDVPEWGEPGCAGGSSLVHASLAFSTHEPAADPMVLVVAGGRVVWTVTALPGSTSANIPAAPSSVDEVELLGATPSARLVLMERREAVQGVAWSSGPGARLLVRSCAP